MKITIDTKEDTHEDIKKVIRLLTHIIGEHPTTNQPNVFEESTPTTNQPETPSGNIFGNMFENPQTEPKTEETTEQKEKETPEIIPY